MPFFRAAAPAQGKIRLHLTFNRFGFAACLRVLNRLAPSMSLDDKLFLASQYLAPHHLVSRFFGMASQCRVPAVKDWMIRTFIRRYAVDMREAANPNPKAYEHFNAFFTRELKSGVRPIERSKSAVVCPADGAISQIGTIDGERVFQAKGHHFSVVDLLGGSPARAEPFLGGEFATIYLSPKDYHRVHMPATGVLREMVHIPGRLFSVNPLTARNVPGLFARNERVACLFDTDQGPMAVVLVGAMIVGSIETVWQGPVVPIRQRVSSRRYDLPQGVASLVRLERGAEMGRFKLGSTVVVLFSPQRMSWNPSLIETSPVRMGETLGHFSNQPTSDAPVILSP
jgi:phosphatidylserine decarboxylase